MANLHRSPSRIRKPPPGESPQESQLQGLGISPLQRPHGFPSANSRISALRQPSPGHRDRGGGIAVPPPPRSPSSSADQVSRSSMAAFPAIGLPDYRSGRAGISSDVIPLLGRLSMADLSAPRSGCGCAWCAPRPAVCGRLVERIAHGPIATSSRRQFIVVIGAQCGSVISTARSRHPGRSGADHRPPRADPPNSALRYRPKAERRRVQAPSVLRTFATTAAP